MYYYVVMYHYVLLVSYVVYLLFLFYFSFKEHFHGTLFFMTFFCIFELPFFFKALSIYDITKGLEKLLTMYLIFMLNSYIQQSLKRKKFENKKKSNY